jgi:inhibitor of cysteine peptidase
VRFLVVFAAALAFACAALGAGPGKVIGIGEQKDGEDTKAHVGDTLVVSLSANPSTGYAWKLSAVNRAVLRLDSTGYIAAKHPPLVVGSRGIQILTFKVLARGTTTLKLAYVKAGTAAPAKTFKVLIHVVIRTA